MSRKIASHRVCYLAVAALALGMQGHRASASQLLPPGFRPLPLGTRALTGGRIVIRPGEVLTNGTLVIREGRIAAVGKDVAPPADARVWEMKGTTIYAGFIDLYLPLEATNSAAASAPGEAAAGDGLTASGPRFFGVPGAQPDRGPAGRLCCGGHYPGGRRRSYAPKAAALAPMHALGFTAGLVAPARASFAAPVRWSPCPGMPQCGGES